VDVLAAFRRAIKASGEPLAAIARRARMDHGQLSRLVRGERAPGVPALERLAAALGLRLELRAAARRRRAGGGVAAGVGGRRGSAGSRVRR